jgi:prepilin-type N-terminal cleavage/methylation domain-containing protein
MSHRSTNRERGFSLLEMVVAMALGTIVLGAAVQLYSQGVSATWTVSQRAEMQEDFRAASDMLTRDLSLAGAGMGDNVQLALPATATPPVFGCDQSSKCYINGAAANYPTQGGTPYLYGLIPGWKYGPILLPAQGATDTVTVVYTDVSFYVQCYSVSVTSSTVVNFQLLTALATNPNCVLPSGTTSPQNLNDPVAGLTAGDLVLFTVTTGTGKGAKTSQIVAEVTAPPVSVAPNPSTTYSAAYNVSFSTGDVLKMNQTTAPSGSLSSVVGWTGMSSRILVTTYYIDNTGTTPRLMRQVSGHTPLPVAENVVFLQFSYDLFNSNTGTVATSQADGGVSLGLTPNEITKINILHMAMNSTLKGGMFANKGYQSLDLETSVSARNLTFQNGYPLGP